MFEKYNLIHFDVITELHDNTTESFPSYLTYKSDKNAPSLIKWKDITQLSNNASKSKYGLNGSFDVLMPPVADADSDTNNDDYFHLQSFCIMKNFGGYYTHRTDSQSLLLSYTYEGEGTLLYHGKQYVLHAGEGFLIDCRDEHEYFTSSDTWSHIDFHFWGKSADMLYQNFKKDDLVTYSCSLELYTNLMESFLDSYIFKSVNRAMYIHGAITNILCRILKEAEKDSASSVPDTYKYLIRYMESNYKKPLSLDDLVNFSNVSKFHLSREFKKYTGFSPNEYLITLRLQHASILLSSSAMTVEQIAEEVGMYNISNFIYLFKKHTRMTPSAFRKSRANLYSPQKP